MKLLDPNVTWSTSSLILRLYLDLYYGHFILYNFSHMQELALESNEYVQLVTSLHRSTSD